MTIGSVSNFLYNKFTQHPTIQNICIGLGSIRLGVNLWRMPADSVTKQLAQALVGTVLVVEGVFGVADSLSSMTREYSQQQIYWDPIIAKGKSPAVKNFSGDQLSHLEFVKRPTNSLYLSGSVESDYNRAFFPGRLNSLPACLNGVSNLVYKVVRNPVQICEEIKLASQDQPIENLIIAGHGNPVAISLSPESTLVSCDWMPSDCFQGLSSKAKIFLHSCSTGGKDFFFGPNFAEWLSLASGKEVIAPTEDALNVAACQLDKNDQLDIRFFNGQGSDVTKSFSPENFNSTKLCAPFTALSACSYFSQYAREVLTPGLVHWQTLRLGILACKVGTEAAERLIDQSAPYVKTLAQKSRVYHPVRAETLYAGAKGSCQLLNTVAKMVDKGMDIAIFPMSQLGSWALGKGFDWVEWVVSNLREE